MTSPSPKVRVRFAPAPSGSLHVGNARTALFNWLFARHHGGVFILRIEDTDRSRVSEEYIGRVMDVLRWLGLDWDEGPGVGGPYAPYRQSERMDLYAKAGETLLAEGLAFRCYCTPEEIKKRKDEARAEGKPPPRRDPCRNLSDVDRGANAADAKPSVMRFKVPDDGDLVFEDLVHGEVRTKLEDIEDFSMMRSDGSPLYVLASAVDDLAMDVTHIIRGEDLISAAPKQILIYRALGAHSWPLFAHLPLIVGANRQPLSKRHGETSVEWYQEHGYLPEALVNYLALLGWSPGDGVTERFTVPELIELFSLDHISRNPAAFDVQKLTALNGEKIRALSPEELAARLEPFLIGEKVLSDPPSEEERALVARAVPLIQERLATLAETPDQLRFMFRDADYDEKARALLQPKNADVLEGALEALTKLDEWTKESIFAALDEVATKLHLRRKEAFQPVRAAVTFSTISPPLPESMELLGKDRTLERIRAALARSRGSG
jgi:glutamyl-tRNA synthetase